MLGFLTTQRTARVIAAAAFVLAIGGPSEAPAKSKPKKVIASVAPAVAAATPISAPPGARFFTINQVLDKKYDGQLRGNSPVRLAAMHPSDTTPSKSMTDAAVQPPAQPMASDEPFGMRAFRAPEGLLWVKWRQVEADIKVELETLQECRDKSEDCTSSGARRFALIIDEVKARQGRARIEVVNRLINSSVRYVSDLTQHGVLDRWTAPLATLTAGQGDCEDYAIAKYVALREAGVEAEDLRFLLVRDRVAGDHAVLGVRHEGRWLILDNRYLTLADTSELSHFTPLFALDHQGVKLFAAPYASRSLTGAETAPAAKPDDQATAPLDIVVAARDAGPGDWSVTPLLL